MLCCVTNNPKILFIWPHEADWFCWLIYLTRIVDSLAGYKSGILGSGYWEYVLCGRQEDSSKWLFTYIQEKHITSGYNLWGRVYLMTLPFHKRAEKLNFTMLLKGEDGGGGEWEALGNILWPQFVTTEPPIRRVVLKHWARNIQTTEEETGAERCITCPSHTSNTSSKARR